MQRRVPANRSQVETSRPLSTVAPETREVDNPALIPALPVDGGLGVVALQVGTEAFHLPRVRISQIDLALWALGRLVGIGLWSEAPTVLIRLFVR